MMQKWLVYRFFILYNQSTPLASPILTMQSTAGSVKVFRYALTMGRTSTFHPCVAQTAEAETPFPFSRSWNHCATF